MCIITCRCALIKVYFVIVSLCNWYVYLYLQALVNVPAPTERTLRRDIASSPITTLANIQVCVYQHPYVSVLHAH